MGNARSVIKRLRFPLDIMLLCVRWYIAYPLSLRNLEEMMQERAVCSRSVKLAAQRRSGCRTPCRAVPPSRPKPACPDPWSRLHALILPRELAADEPNAARRRPHRRCYDASRTGVAGANEARHFNDVHCCELYTNANDRMSSVSATYSRD